LHHLITTSDSSLVMETSEKEEKTEKVYPPVQLPKCPHATTPPPP
jgi:hypothetical protein